ncbi:MAG: hypothetical protein KL839_09605 [Rhizobium sp.]|nr:hypothetical protein [Rhizobium sp.]
MPELRTQDDEFDIMEFIELLWGRKFFLILVMSAFSVIGILYYSILPQYHIISIPYRILIYTVNGQQLCGGEFACIDDRADDQLELILRSEWDLNRRVSTISKLTGNTLTIREYDEVKHKFSKAFTSAVYQEAQSELELIAEEFGGNIQGDDVIAANMLNAKRVMREIDRGRSAVDFGAVSILKSSPRLELILPLSMSLGGLSGVLIVVMKNTIRQRREEKSLIR